MHLLLTTERDMTMDRETKSMPVPVLVNIDAYDVIARLNEAATKIVGSVLYTKAGDSDHGHSISVLETPVVIWGMIRNEQQLAMYRDVYARCYASGQAMKMEHLDIVLGGSDGPKSDSK